MKATDIQKIPLTPINQFKSTWLHQKMKNFPKCNIRYGTEDGHGFILIGPGFTAKQFNLLCEKIIAVLAGAVKSLRITVIPLSYANVSGI